MRVNLVPKVSRVIPVKSAHRVTQDSKGLPDLKAILVPEELPEQRELPET